ncbi:hypothetical protein F4814DRAFT_450322 [Daldinia grandis]|nr:hypothetical protein F4814DRAFT_450322 [Daldinia grandis]
MLSKWKIGSKSSSPILLEESYISCHMNFKAPRVRACTQCRAKKVRCTKEKTGCERCRLSSRECIYQGPQTKGVPFEIVSPHEQEARLSAAWNLSDTLEERYETNHPSWLSVDTTLQIPSGPREDYPVDAIPELADVAGLDQYETSEPKISNMEGIYEPSLDLAQLGSSVWPFAQLDTILPAPELTEPDDTLIEISTSPDTELNDGNLNANVGMESLCHFEFEQSCEEWQYVANRHSDQTTYHRQCLHTHRSIPIVFDLEDIAIGIDNLDKVLNTNKEALRRGNDMIDCEICMAHFENITVLTSLIEKLGKTCQDISGAYPQLLPVPVLRGTAQPAVPT